MPPPKKKASGVLCSGVNSCVVLQVQTDQYVSTEDLQVEMGQLDKHLEALEQKGVELERNLRACKNGANKIVSAASRQNNLPYMKCA